MLVYQWLNPYETADLVTFTKEILNGKLDLLCSDHDFGIDIFFKKDGENRITGCWFWNSGLKHLLHVCIGD